MLAANPETAYWVWSATPTVSVLRSVRLLISVIWKDMTRNGALPSWSALITVIVWKHFELLGLYEIIHLHSLAIYIVSKLGSPTHGMLQRFAAAEADFRLNK